MRAEVHPPPAGVPLSRRACHYFFLKKLALERNAAGQVLGELTTAEVVRTYVKPATAVGQSSLAEHLVLGPPLAKYDLGWCQVGGKFKDGDGATQQAFGPARFFVSHAWSYKFGALVSMLENHYSGLPGTRGGAKYVPMGFYWVDILAVTQHFTGDFKDSPDSDFAGVIRASKAVLFTMHPWRSPIAPTRVWCLFEALTAIEASGVQFEVIVDVKDSKDTRVQTVQVISNSIDVRTAQATVSSDRTYILSCIESGIGVAAFNNAIRKRLREALLQAVTRTAADMGDTAALHELLKIGGCVRPDGILDLPALFKYAGEPDILSVLRSLCVRDLRPRGLVLSGRQRAKEVNLTDGGLRGWDGSEFSLREYTEVETGRLLWGYLPASPALCQAVADVLVGGGPAVPPGAGAGAPPGSSSSSSKGVEELWISLRAPKPEDFGGVSASSPGSPKGTNGSSASTLSLTGGSRSGTGSPAAPASATAARAAARAVAASPGRRRASGAGMSSLNMGSSFTGASAGTTTAAIPGASSRSVTALQSPARRPASGLSTTTAAAAGVGSSGSSPTKSGRGSMSGVPLAGDVGPSSQQPGACGAGRPALWAAVGACRTLRTLVLHMSVMGPQDLQMLRIAVQTNRQLETLSVVKCVPAGTEARLASGIARLNAELLSIGLGDTGLRQLYLQPGDLASIAALHMPARACLNLRRLVLSPVALSMAAIRQLGDALAPLPRLERLEVGMDPSPSPLWMPKESVEREQWLAYEDRNEPEMATRRRRYLGLDDEGQSALTSSAWDFRDELAALPDPTKGDAALRQRAAALAFFLTISAGWRPLDEYNRQYSRWAWMKRCQQDDGLADLKNSFNAYKTFANDLLKAAPEAFAARFNMAVLQRQGDKPTRLQLAFWELYG